MIWSVKCNALFLADIVASRPYSTVPRSGKAVKRRDYAQISASASNHCTSKVHPDLSTFVLLTSERGSRVVVSSRLSSAQERRAQLILYEFSLVHLTGNDRLYELRCCFDAFGTTAGSGGRKVAGLHTCGCIGLDARSTFLHRPPG